MTADPMGYWIAGGIALAIVAFCIGRGTGASARRRRELEAQLADARGESARLATERAALAEQLRAARAEHEAYRLDVVEHFSGTSDLLRDLTVQYRSVYEHLTKGASRLCPEGFVGLTEGLPIPELAPPSGEPAATPAPPDRDAPGIARGEQRAPAPPPTR
ncbi:MAG TPA: DUF1043 family protein [Myxococcota bacterium]|nr:DUF1043 family protein [Myxococcota bacterium]